MGRYSGILFKLVEEAAAGGCGTGKRNKANWSKVFHYLEAHSFSDANVRNPTFDSPLPPFTAPSESLSTELLEKKGGSRHDSTVLKIAVCVAPAMIVAALCHLQPQAAAIVDHQGRIPLHLACRRSQKDNDTRVIFEVLIACYKKGLVERDSGGRTPLHYLFAYYAPLRTPEVVEMFCQALPENAFKGVKQPQPSPDQQEDPDSMRFPLPEIPTPSQKEKIPLSAAIVHDAMEGSLPLHYAVVKGASREVIKLLLDAYPDSKFLGDRRGRTALALYFGASLLDGKVTRNVNGDTIDPNDAPYWDSRLESTTVKLLLSSKVARTADYTGRYPLHWACCLLGKHYYSGTVPGTCLSLKAFQLLKDHHVEALVIGDLSGKTPLHHLFDSVREQQQLEWKRICMNKVSRDNVRLDSGGPSAFTVPLKVVELLLSEATEERVAAVVEDNSGRLPIHAALEVATCADVIKFLIKTHPASLLHTTEEQLVSPLHAALISPFSAPLQTVETMQLVLEAYVASRHGSFVDGRLALKMEDADGNYPIHYACRNQACLDVIKLFVDKYPKGSLFQNADGDLPLHALLDDDLFSSKDGKPPIGASLANSDGLEGSRGKKLHQKQLEVFQQKVKILIDPILASSDSGQLLKITSSAHGMLPLHIAVAFGAASYCTLYTMLDLYPEGASKSASANGASYSTLDLHNMYRSNCFESDTLIDADWHSVRELLFSFHPMDNKHRHDEDLLAQSVRLVRSEIRCEGSYHLTQKEKMSKSSPIPDIELTETLKSIEMPELETGGRPFWRRNNNNNTRAIRKSKSGVSKKCTPSPSTSTMSKPGEKAKSIYDDDGSCLDYVVSEAGTDSYEESFSGPESAEEYMSDEYEENESFDDDDHVEISWDPSAAAVHLSGKGCKLSSKEKKEQEDKKEDTLHEEQAAILDPNEPPLSEVTMRIMSFFMLFCNSKNPSDNYAQQVESILDDISRSLVDTIISMPVPAYSAQYLENVVRLEGLSFRELASPKSREVIKKLFYFLGRFDFDSETGGILLHRTSGNSTVLVRATEWTFTTEEYNDAPKLDPGVVEAEIWETGVVPAEKVGFMGSTFRAMKRSICFLFTNDKDIYRNEVQCRSDLGVAVEGGKLSKTHVIPLITHFNAHGVERSQDRHYKMDINNDTFSKLHLFGGKNTNKSSADESICLSEYPYALTFSYSNYGDLFDYFFRHGVEGPDETREICSQIGKTLRSMHEKGIVHGNICMRNITLYPSSGIESVEETRKYWGLTNLSGAFRLKDGNCFLGAIYSQGTIQFHSASLPPEMFMRLSNADLKMYNEYWDAVERIFGVKIDKSVIKPVIDFQTGDSYVMRCHFVPSEADMHAAKQLPQLPYKRLPARESSDMWAFGQLLFMLTSSGRPLFPTNARTGHLLNYREISLWDLQAAENMVYEHVEDPLAQDILLLLLSPYEQRASCSMKTVMSHPFFKHSKTLSSAAQKIVEQREESSNIHILSLRNKVSTLSEEQWLREKTISIDCWDFDFLARFHLAPTTLIPQIMSLKVKGSTIPSSFILLPYKLSLNKKSKLTPGTKKDVERAEKLGMKILTLCKACHFVNLVDQIINKEKSSTRIWSFAEIVEELNLPEGQFEGVTAEMERLAAHYVELFRYDPVSVGVRIVQGKIKELLSCFEDSKKMWLYLVDEYRGVPVVESVAALYPHLVPDNIRTGLLQKGLPFMYLCARYSIGVSKGVLGLVKLIFEAAYPHIPPSWQAASVGLDCCLDRDSIIGDVKILRAAMFGLYAKKYQPESSNNDLDFILEYFLEIDAEKTFAKLERVSSGGGFVWTTPDGVGEIKNKCESYGFREAFHSNLKTKQMLEDKQNEIQNLKEELEKLKFRKDLNLEVPAFDNRPQQQERYYVKAREEPAPLEHASETENAKGRPAQHGSDTEDCPEQQGFDDKTSSTDANLHKVEDKSKQIKPCTRSDLHVQTSYNACGSDPPNQNGECNNDSEQLKVKTNHEKSRDFKTREVMIPESPSDEQMLNKKEKEIGSEAHTGVDPEYPVDEAGVKTTSATTITSETTDDISGQTSERTIVEQLCGQQKSDSNESMLHSPSDDYMQQQRSVVNREKTTTTSNENQGACHVAGLLNSNRDMKLPTNDSLQEVYYDVLNLENDKEVQNHLVATVLDNDLDELMATNDSLLREVNEGNRREQQESDGTVCTEEKNSAETPTEVDTSDALRDFFAREVAKLPTMETKLHNLQDELEKMRLHLEDPVDQKPEKKEVGFGMDNFFLPDLLNPVDEDIADVRLILGERDERVMKTVTTDTTDASETISDNESQPVKS